MARGGGGELVSGGARMPVGEGGGGGGRGCRPGGWPARGPRLRGVEGEECELLGCGWGWDRREKSAHAVGREKCSGTI